MMVLLSYRLLVMNSSLLEMNTCLRMWELKADLPLPFSTDKGTTNLKSLQSKSLSRKTTIQANLRANRGCSRKSFTTWKDITLVTVICSIWWLCSRFNSVEAPRDLEGKK